MSEANTGQRPTLFTCMDFKLWRISNGYTRKSLAKALGLGKSTIDKYENGTREDDGEIRDVTIPLTVRYALSALHAGLDPVGGSDVASGNNYRRPSRRNLAGYLNRGGA